MIAVRGLSFRYPHQAVDALHDVTMHIRDGGLFGLLGPNGSGKTTFLSVVAGLRRVTDGQVTVAGQAYPAGTSKIRSLISFVPQSNAFYDRFTVGENLAFFAGVQHIPDAAARMADVAAVTGIDAVRHVRAARLSGGMKRRLSIAIGLLNNPRLLLLDEPTVGIDPQSRRLILDAVRRLNAAGTTVVYASHDLSEVEGLCDEVGILEGGRVVVQRPLAALLAGGGTRRLRIECSAALTGAQQEAARRIPNASVTASTVEVDPCDAASMIALVADLRGAGAEIVSVRFGAMTLEERFLALTAGNGAN